MKILMLNYEYPPLGGGAGNATYYILREFAGDPSVTVDLVTSSVGGFETVNVSENITVHRLDISKGMNPHHQTVRELLTFTRKATRYARRLIREKQYDLIHAFFGIPCGVMARFLGLPYIVSLRGSDVPFFNPRFRLLDIVFFRALSRRIWCRAHAVTANSDGLRELAMEVNAGIDIQIICNGVDCDAFRPLRVSAKPVEPGKLRLVSTGRLTKRKGYEYLFRAIHGMDGIEVILIGDGDLRDSLMEQARGMNLQVEFRGALGHDAMLEELSLADVFVAPSLNEGMSNSVLEAMACGLPIVMTDVGGSSELIDGNGFVVPTRSPDALREALNTYRNDSCRLRQHSEKSMEQAKQFSWRNVSCEIMALYRRCLQI